MELSDAVRARRMARTYRSDRPVPREVIGRLLDLATRAPSAGFSQGRDFVVLTRLADLARYWTAATGASDAGALTDAAAAPDRWLSGMRSAPALVLCLSDPNRYLDRYAEPDKGWADRDEARWPVPYWDVDTGMAAMVMLLAAVDQQLAACFFGVPPDRTAAVLAAFGIPPDRRLVGVISLGYPAPDRRSPSLRRGRRPVTEVAHDGQFGTPWQS
jgi:nitroreductase